MSVIQSPLFTNSRGSLKNFVIYTANGQIVIRTKPSNFHDKKSPKQLKQRARFKSALDLYKRLDTAFGAAWKEEARKMTMNACNLFMKENIRHIDAEGILTDPSQLKISIGSLPLPAHLQMVTEKEKTIYISWDFDSLSIFPNQYDDLLQIGVFGVHSEDEDDEKYIYYIREAKAYRHEQCCRFKLNHFRGKADIYACFKSHYTSAYSNSVHLGSCEV